MIRAAKDNVGLLTGAGLRFLLSQSRGRLVALDPANGRTVEQDVHYTASRDGVLMAVLCGRGEVLGVIERGGAVSLIVDRHTEPTGAGAGPCGLPTEHAVAGVRALVDAEVVEHYESRVADRSVPIACVTLVVVDLEVASRADMSA
jgi:hypothetical protein